jgi:hypothetical protein
MPTPLGGEHVSSHREVSQILNCHKFIAGAKQARRGYKLAPHQHGVTNSRTGGAVNLSTAAALTAALVFALGAGPGRTMQEQKQDEQQQSDKSQPLDEVAVTKITGTIEKIDPDKRVMTLKLDNGKKKTLKVDKSVKDLGKFKVGDRVQMSYTEEVIMMAQPSSEGTAQVAKFGSVEVQSEGDKPALVKVDTSVISGKIVSIDPKKKRLTFEDPDGKKKTVKLSRRIKNLDKFKSGDDINMAITDELVVAVVA